MNGALPLLPGCVGRVLDCGGAQSRHLAHAIVQEANAYAWWSKTTTRARLDQKTRSCAPSCCPLAPHSPSPSLCCLSSRLARSVAARARLQLRHVALPVATWTRPSTSARNELGETTDAFRETIAYQQRVAGFVRAMANGDLTMHVEPNSERDVLGNAFASMIGNLRLLVGQARASAINLGNTSTQVGSATNQTSAAVQQLANACASPELSRQGRRLARLRRGVARRGAEAPIEGCTPAAYYLVNRPSRSRLWSCLRRIARSR